MQMPDKHNNQQDEALEAPPRLISALKGLPIQPVFVPPTADEAILRAAREHLVPPQEPRLRRIFIMPWLATAAALILMLALIPRFVRSPAPVPNGVSSFAREDINHDGKVDILDAFALARQLKAGSNPSPQLDVNGDGVVDERDVDSIAAQAVSLGKGGRS
jgi:hypothetical protein